MKSVVASSPEVWPFFRVKVATYLELTKPRISILVLFTVAAGYCLASQGAIAFLPLLHVVLGTGLIASGASALNQLLERDYDALMERTETRPLPSGRVTPFEVLSLGIVLGIVGLFYLSITIGQPLCIFIAALTFVKYVWIYTPLKRVTTYNTLIGAIPGALPPLIGWTATGQGLSLDGLVLFLILFLWQIPHFLAIAWIYRSDYSRGGFRMLSVVDATGKSTAWHMVIFCLALLLVGIIPFFWEEGLVYFLLGSTSLGGYFLWTAICFCRERSINQARKVLRASLLYLPSILILLLVCHVIRNL